VNGGGTRGLCAAILLQAVADARRGGRLQKDALAWIDFDQGGPFTFRWMCDHIDIDPAMVRKAAQNGSRER
jgi:hypothetical protein